jgi:hypothetical protein
MDEANGFRDLEERPGLQFGMRAVFVLVTIIAVLIGGAAALRRAAINEKGPHRPFVASEWKEAPDPTRAGERGIRSEMVFDLLERYDFTGWSRAQVVALLGLGTAPRRGSGFEQWDRIYFLGLERSGAFSLDDEVLGFEFNNSGRVVDFGTSVN